MINAKRFMIKHIIVNVLIVKDTENIETSKRKKMTLHL